MRSNRGFSLVELLVVIAIIGLLMGMLLPALGVVRETARQAECKSRLGQLANACEQYMASHGMVPFSISHLVEGPNPDVQVSGRGWIVPLLPLIDRRNEYNDLVLTGNFQDGEGMASSDPEHVDILQMNFPLLKCPSDGDSDILLTAQPEFPGASLASTNYKGCIGDTRLADVTGGPSIFAGSEPDCHATNPCNGLFWRNSYQFPRRFDRFSEGTAQTFMIGEDVPRMNDHSAWFFANGDWATCNIPLNYNPDPPTPADWVNVMSFRSRHPGGAFFCFADKHVRYIADNIDMTVYRALSTRDSKNPVQTNELILSASDYE
jgi:prepilin-type N-terminal cleavage/methylation domain-containing protein